MSNAGILARLEKSPSLRPMLARPYRFHLLCGAREAGNLTGATDPNLRSAHMQYNIEAHLQELARQETTRAFQGSSGGVMNPAVEADQALARWRERFAIPQSVPTSTQSISLIDLDTGGITFGGGVPVGGTSHLTLRS